MHVYIYTCLGRQPQRCSPIPGAVPVPGLWPSLLYVNKSFSLDDAVIVVVGQKNNTAKVQNIHNSWALIVALISTTKWKHILFPEQVLWLSIYNLILCNTYVERIVFWGKLRSHTSVPHLSTSPPGLETIKIEIFRCWWLAPLKSSGPSST